MTFDEYIRELERLDATYVDLSYTLDRLIDGSDEHLEVIGIESEFAREVLIGRLKTRLIDAQEGRRRIAMIRQMIEQVSV